MQRRARAAPLQVALASSCFAFRILPASSLTRIFVMHASASDTVLRLAEQQAKWQACAGGSAEEGRRLRSTL